jgi:hypothetical protein
MLLRDHLEDGAPFKGLLVVGGGGAEHADGLAVAGSAGNGGLGEQWCGHIYILRTMEIYKNTVER